MSDELDAVVIGSGPNGLAAAITVAQHGGSVLVVEGADAIGGGLRSAELTGPGLVHDVCSTIHTIACASPFLRSLPLAAHGLEWAHPDTLLAHPVGPERAALLQRSVAATAEGLGPDGARYRGLVEPLVEHWDEIEGSVLGPILRLPRHPLALARFGLRAMLPATWVGGRFATPEAAALFAGNAAHAFLPLHRPFTSAFGLMLMVLGHRFGWPFVRGGSGALAEALASHLRELGGTIETGRFVTDLADLPRSRVILADVTPTGLVQLMRGRVPDSVLRPYQRFRHGPAAFKLDYALSEPVPWTNPELAGAGTIHLGGTAESIAAAESATWSGRAAARPFTLVCQPTVTDPSRSSDGRHALWVYGHVPNGSTTDHREAIERLIIEMAPDFLDVVLERSVMTPADLEAHDPNLVGGDVSGGAHDIGQLVFRPVARLDPYTTPIDRLFICSSSTPPGAGAHGMSGHLAARSAIARWLS
jgi:phytoene dehydrogenase-like protein